MASDDAGQVDVLDASAIERAQASCPLDETCSEHSDRVNKHAEERSYLSRGPAEYTTDYCLRILTVRQGTSLGRGLQSARAIL